MLELKNIDKAFPGVKALDDVSINFLPGEIHALLGENGAGKSTLMKIISGIYVPDAGSITLNGTRLKLKSYNDAMKNSIGIVNQEIQVVPDFSVGENIMLDKLSSESKCGCIRWGELYKKAKKNLEAVELDVDPRDNIRPFSAAQKQLIQIAKALSANAKVLLLDEPTSSLTQKEVVKLFSVLRRLKNEGTIIIFISHKVEEVLEISDRVSVLRDGKLIGSRPCVGLTRQEIIKMMIGRETQDKYLGKLDIEPLEKVLDIRNICQGKRFKDISMYLRKGEILGLYGLVGSGRSELMRIIIGEDKADSGEIYINGRKARIRSISDSVDKYGMCYVTENRKEEGLLLEDSVMSNLSIAIWNRLLNKLGKISIKTEKRRAQSIVDELQIKCTGLNQKTEFLSGGNQQKISIGKWLLADCDILIIDEPTVGVDVGAKETIHNIIWNMAKIQKKSIILISSDMPELCALARRILVFRDNRIVGEIDGINDREYEYGEISSEIGKYLVQ